MAALGGNVFGARHSKDELLAKLREVEAELAALPVREDRFVQAQELIEELKAAGVSAEEMNATLSARGLPSVPEVGQAVLKSMVPLAKLSRKQRKLEQRLAKFDD